MTGRENLEGVKRKKKALRLRKVWRDFWNFIFEKFGGAMGWGKLVSSSVVFLNAVVNYESIKGELQRRLIYEYRCDERLKLKLRNLHAWQTLEVKNN